MLATLRQGIAGLLKARKVTVYSGRGLLNGAGRVVVQKTGQETKAGTPPVATAPGNTGEKEEFTADHVILAVGSVPARIPGWPTDPEVVCTSDEALHWKTLPRKLLIVGGGVIGCEFACMMQPLGVEVTVVEMLPQLLPNLDGDAARMLAKVFELRGVKVHTGVKIDRLEVRDGLAEAQLATGEKIGADRVLVATGRRPNTKDVGLESVGITTDRGFVRVNDCMRVALGSAGSLYGIGDANGRCLLAHAASAQGITAVENALGCGHELHAPIPNCVYTFPEIAGVGMTVEEAKKAGLPYNTGLFPLSHLGKALAAGESDGFVKVVRNRETDEILGVHMLGHNVTEVIASAGALLHTKAKVQEVVEVVFAHPTMSEAVKEAAEDALSMGLHAAPKKVMRVMAEVG